MNPDLTPIPEPLRALVDDYWQRFVAAGAAPALQRAVLDADLPRVWAVSDFVAKSCIRSPEMLDRRRVERLTRASAAGEIAAEVDRAVAGVEDEAALEGSLRRIRRGEMVRIAWRDLAGAAPLDETLTDLSDLADACVQAALAKLAGWHAARFGEVRDAGGRPQSLVVLGFGKLGARELNFSSDIDLVFVYPDAGVSDGSRTLDSDEYFARLGQRLIGVLDRNTADGFVFRVDMRLRPFGGSGPLAMSFAAMENYYQNHGREWERYALVKARPVAGDLDAGERLLRTLRPFVYRRYLDFNAFESLRDMKAMIAREVAREGLENNIKLGRGGIREVEFVGQVFQLIRGGREAALRQRGIRPVLAHLADAGYLESADAAALDAAYVFLRRVENRLQMAADRQTHDLPEDDPRRLRLAWAMGFAGWPGFHAALEAHRAAVRTVFDQVFTAAGDDAGAGDTAAYEAWGRITAGVDAGAALAELGLDAADGAAALDGFLDSVNVQDLSARARRRLGQLMPRLIGAAAETSRPDAVLKSLLGLLEVVAGRTTYLALLAENDNVLPHLARFAAASPWLVQLVTRVPLLMDELIDPRLFQSAPDAESLEAELAAALAGVVGDDQEAEMDALRQFQQAAVLRIAAADLSGHADPGLVSEQLTALAEVVIRSVMSLTRPRLAARHGEPFYSDGGGRRPAHLGIVAYGKLGGRELGYGSDLDLVFIHDSRGESRPTDGARPIDSGVFFARWSQRIISFLSMPTTAGILYSVDTRLRPSGNAGLLVSGFDSFARYQRERAWTWEHQALVRARPVAGDAALADRFAALRREILCRERDEAALRADIAAMRERMRRELSVETRAGFDIKQDPGGLTDIEFLVQYRVLRHAHAHPALIEQPDNIATLEALAARRLIPADAAAELTAAYRDYRGRSHRLTLEGWNAVVPDDEFQDVRAAVAARWREVFGKGT